MASANPFNLWRRFLAAPNDSAGKTLVVALLVFGGAAATAFPQGLEQLSHWPLLSWGLLALGFYLLWPRRQP